MPLAKVSWCIFLLVESQGDIYMPGLAPSTWLSGWNSQLKPVKARPVTVSLPEVALISEEKGRGKDPAIFPQKSPACGLGPSHCEGGRSREG